MKATVSCSETSFHMYKYILLLLIIVCLDVNAQKGFYTLGAAAETTVPFFQDDQGFGFSLKAAYGIGKSGQLILSAGVSKLNSKNSSGTEKITTRLIPVLFGYRQNIKQFFIEPKIGIGELGGKIAVNGDYARPSVAVVFGGLEAGYSIKRFDIGINFLNAKGIENACVGIWYNKNVHYTSIFVNYNLFSKSHD